MGWKQILDDQQIGQLFPGNAHDHSLQTISQIGDVNAGHCTDPSMGVTNAATAAQCCCDGPNNCADWDALNYACDNSVNTWTEATPDYTGGVTNSHGDIIGLFQTSNFDDYTNQLVFLSQSSTNASTASWALANAADDTSGAKNLLGISLTSSADSAVKVLTSGYLAIDDSLFTSTGTSLAPGQVVYMSAEEGKLINMAPTVSTNVVRVVGYILQLDPLDNSNLILNLKPDAVWIEVA